MATYLQGVEAYIPQIQPFQEDLNQYANMLGTAQQKYDTNYKKINQVYGSFFYADLSRESNLERRDEVLKNVDFNLKRVAGLDLSLEQNVTQAMQVFKPFYEDKYMMKDMAWTKNLNNQKSIAQSYLNSKDEKTRSMYWDAGTRALDYMREEFREVSDEDSLGMGNAQYTPYVNSVKKAMEIAKEAGLNIEKIDFSQDGKWLVKTKNGEALMEPLYKLFEATLASDPAIQKVYQTQAYVNRKDFAYSNAGMFDGDPGAAENQYLQNAYNMLKQESQIKFQQAEQENTTYTNRIKEVEAQLKSGTADPTSLKYLQSLQMNKQISDQTLAAYRQQAEQFEEYSGTSATSNQIPYGSIENLRYKVDSAMASKLMQKDMGEAAQIFAYKNHSVDIDANPYAVNEQKHAFKMQEVAARNAGLANAARIKSAADLEKQYRDHMFSTGLGAYDPVTKQFTLTDAGVQASVSGEAATASVNVKEQLYKRNTELANDLLTPKLQAYDNALQELLNKTEITPEEVKNLLGMDLKTFRNEYQNNADRFARYKLTPKGLDKLIGNLDAYFEGQGNKEVLTKENRDALAIADQGFQEYTSNLKNSQEWMVKSAKLVVQELKNKGIPNADYYYDLTTGRRRTEKEFNKILEEKSGKPVISYEDKIREQEIRKQKAVKSGDSNEYYLANKAIKSFNRALAYDTDNDFSGLYDKITKAASVVYSDNKLWAGDMTPPIGLNALGGGGTGVAGRVNEIDANPAGSIGTESGRLMHSVFADLKALDLGSENVDISISGFGTKDNKITESEDRVFVNGILKNIMSEGVNHKTKIGNIGIIGSAVAQGSMNREAVKVLPSQKYIGVLKKMYADDEAKLAIINEIAGNGISVVADQGSFNTPLVKGIRMTPLEANIDYAINNGRSYVITDPTTKSTVEVYKNEAGTSNYSYRQKVNLWNPVTNSYEVDPSYTQEFQYSTILPDDALRGFTDFIRNEVIPYNQQIFYNSLKR